MSRTIAVHVRYNSLYISLSSSARQQRKVAKFCVVWRTSATTANFPNVSSKFFAVSQIQFRVSFGSEKQRKWLKSFTRFIGKGFFRQSFSKPRREHHKTKGLMSRTIAVHLHYKSLHISLPSSAKQQREVTSFCVFWRTWATEATFSYFLLELNAGITY